jgi:hypothetical protein
VVTEFDGCSGAAAGRVAQEYHGRLASSLSREEAARLLQAMRAQAKPVNPERLGAVGPLPCLPPAYVKTVATVKMAAGRGDTHALLPCVVEAWAGPDVRDTLTLCVNRTPITGKVSLERQKDKTVGLFGCGLHHKVDVGRQPVRLVVNVQIPYMPITSDGKEPDFTVLLQPFAESVVRAAKKARRIVPAVSRASDESRSQKDVIVACLPTAIHKASGGRAHRYSQRQLFYAVRPYFLDAFGKEPAFGYFCEVIGEYEDQIGRDLPGMYRDARGTLYHPHTGETIPLGTLAVEGYQRPAWTFNKILYSEKEGFFEILRGEQWPERNDCALVTSKGYASRAARDVLDLLGDTQEELLFFCIHDADAAGTKIYEALQDGTKARRARRVEIVNLGLDPWEALDMGLQVETFEPKKNRLPTAAYVPPRWQQWLQTRRVELNAMTTPQFVQWLDQKMAERGQGKLVPPADVLSAKLRKEVEAHLREAFEARVLQLAGTEQRIQALTEAIVPAGQPPHEALPRIVRGSLHDTPEAQWTQPIRDRAEEMTQGAALPESLADL